VDNISENLFEEGSPRFVAMSRFTVANDMTAQVKQAFADRPHLVDDTLGFVRIGGDQPARRARRDLAADLLE
jgi:hypothetical protein